jgi:hypothetical protein
VFRNFNLSQNKSLRTLETTARSITIAGGDASGFLVTILSTITSPSFLDVVINYTHLDLNCDMWYVAKPARVDGRPSTTREVTYDYHHPMRFRVFNEMHKVLKFRLVLCADVFECIAEHAKQKLEDIVAVEKKNGWLDYLVWDPLIISERRSLHTRINDGRVGSTIQLSILASAL